MTKRCKCTWVCKCKGTTTTLRVRSSGRVESRFTGRQGLVVEKQRGMALVRWDDNDTTTSAQVVDLIALD